MNFYADNKELISSTKKSPSLSRRRFLLRSTAAACAVPIAASGLTSCGNRLPRPRRPIRTAYNTIAHRMLDIELVHVRDARAYETLDHLIGFAEHVLGGPAFEEASEREIAQYYLKGIDEVIRFLDFEYQKNSLLSTALLTRKIDCDGYSAIYLAIGEQLELPIKMVRAPAHTFVRWAFSDGTYLNWETTIGAPKSDKYYIAKHKIPKAARGRNALRSIDVKKNRDQVLANSHVNCGVEWLKKLRYEEAIRSFDRAIRGDALYEAPYYNKGLVYFHMGKMDQAVRWCEKSVHLNPNHMKSHAVLGTAYKELKDAKKARRHFRRVRQLDPEYYAVKIMEMQLSAAPTVGNTAPL